MFGKIHLITEVAAVGAATAKSNINGSKAILKLSFNDYSEI